MRSGFYLFRFFRAVAPVPRLTIVTFIVIVVAASAKVAIAPADARDALMPLLVHQAFAASSGFATPARRGYYDLLLTRGDGRFRVAIAHWIASIAPGIVAWMFVAVVEAIVTVGHGNAVRSSGTIATLFLVSTLPWAITVPLPRFAGAIGWLLVAVTAASFMSPGESAIGGSPFGQFRGDLLTSIGILIYPMEMIGRDVRPLAAVVSVPLALGIAAMMAAIAWIHRSDFALEAAQ